MVKLAKTILPEGQVIAGRFEIREVEKLCKSQDGLLDAYRSGMALQEKGWVNYPAASWDEPAILAFVDDRCVAGINYSRNEDEDRVTVDFAWCSPDHPKALSACLLRFRKVLQKALPTSLNFTCHVGNAPMEKLVAKLGLSPRSQSYRVPATFYQAKLARPKPGAKAKVLGMVLSALRAVEAKIEKSA